jgi:predicted dehydrogenase
MKTGVIGSGHMGDVYLTNMINRFENLEVICIASRHLENAKRKADQYGIEACTVDEMLQNPKVELVVLLTPVETHYRLIKAALEAGKHVYSEKTITETPAQAHELLSLANRKGLYLGAAPDTFLGPSFQAAKKLVDNGELGDIHSFCISGNRCYDALLCISPYLRKPGAGLVHDYGVYYITQLVSLLGPVSEVCAVAGKPYQTRTNNWPDSPEFGKSYEMPNESQISAIIRLKNGITGTIQINADSHPVDQSFFAIYGSKGILYLGSPNDFGGEVKILLPPKNFFRPDPPQIIPQSSAFNDNARGLGVSEMVSAISERRKNRASAEMASHVLDVLSGMLESSDRRNFVAITSTMEVPAAFPVTQK